MGSIHAPYASRPALLRASCLHLCRRPHPRPGGLDNGLATMPSTSFLYPFLLLTGNRQLSRHGQRRTSSLAPARGGGGANDWQLTAHVAPSPRWSAPAWLPVGACGSTWWQTGSPWRTRLLLVSPTERPGHGWKLLVTASSTGRRCESAASRLLPPPARTERMWVWGRAGPR